MAKNVSRLVSDKCLTPNNKMQTKNKPVTPINKDFDDNNNNYKESYNLNFGNMKKSMSMNDITALEDNLEECTPQASPGIACSTPQEMSRTKFISIAEAIYYFPSSVTMLQSPMLHSKTRLKPLHILCRQAKEEMELEEIRKKRFKMNPVPKSVVKSIIIKTCATSKPKEKHGPRIGPLKPKPFTFQKRDEELKRRKEERIRQIRQQIEEERKQATLFKAQPIPEVVKKRMYCNAPNGGPSAKSSGNKQKIKLKK